MDGHSYSSYELRVRAVHAVLDGVSIVAAATAYRVDRGTLHRWLRRYQTAGERGLLRQPGSGRPRKLAELAPDDLRLLVVRPASAYGYESDLWTVRRLRQVIYDRFRVQVSSDTVWRRLREAGLTYQKPERQYFEIDEAARAHWLRYEAPRIRRTVRENNAILYFQDESNVSLTAFLGKTWAPRGQTPKVRVTGARGGVAAVSALSGQGRLIFSLYEKRIASPEVIEFLKQMLRHHPGRHLVVVMDQAPPHVSKATRAFVQSQQRLRVFYLPKYSPDWNPDEKVWNHLKTQELKSHQAKTKSQLKELALRKLQQMSASPELLRGLFFRCCVADFFG
jgi:transposase